MFLNDEQRKGYESLTPKQKRRFRDIEEDHPNWSFDKITMILILEGTFDDAGNNMEGQVNGPADLSPDAWKAIFEEAKTQLQKIQGISPPIIKALDDVISTIKTWIKLGIKRVGYKIGELLRNLF